MRALRSFSVMLLFVCAAAWAKAPDEPAAQGSTSADGGTETPAEVEKSALEEMLQSDEEEKPADAAAKTEAKEPDRTDPVSPLAPPGETSRAEKVGHRGEISDEIGGGNSQSTPENPRAGQLFNTLRGSFYPTENLTLSAGLTVTLEGGSSPPTGSVFQASYGGAIALITVGADYDLSDHWNIGGHFDASPSSEQFSSTVVTYQPTVGSKATADADALLRTRSSSIGGGASLGFDTAGESNLEAAFTLAVTATNLASDERITEVESRTGKVVNANNLRDYCTSAPAVCSKTLKAVLREQQVALVQTRTSAAGTLTFALDTDLTLAGDYYFYSDDPTTLGFFGVATAGRTAGTGGGAGGGFANLGGGVAIAPLQWTLRPELVHRFGRDFTARIWVMFGQYVAGAGEGTGAIGAKIQYKFTRNYRMWLAVSGQKDTDVDGVTSNSSNIALGAAYKF